MCCGPVGSVHLMPTEHDDERLDLVIRLAQIDDLEGMVEVYLRVGEEGLFVAAEPPVDRHERRLWLEHRIDSPWTLVLVALNGTDAIGYLTAVGSERQPAAIGLGVSKMWRNRGVGTKLVEAAIGWGKDQGVHKLATEVFPHNEPTLHLFEKLGFAREGHLRGHYRRSSGALWDVIVLGLQLETTTERERA
jgi:L-amino acid N-acyltransferase YncA